MVPRRNHCWLPALLVGALLFTATGVALSASPVERLTVGLRAYQDGFYSLAAKEMAAFLEAAPQDPRRAQVLYLLAHAQMAQEEWDAARSSLLELAGSGDQRSVEARYWLGWIEQKRGFPREALPFLEQYLAEGGSAAEQRTDALIAAASVLLQLGRYETAAQYYARFLDEAPDDPRRGKAWVAMVQTLVRAGAPVEKVLAAVDTALGEASLGADSAVTVLSEGVREAQVSGRYGDEARLWSLLAEKRLDPQTRGQARFRAGMAHLRAGNTDAGRRELEIFLKGDPQGPDRTSAMLQLIALSRERGDYASLLRYAEALIGTPADLPESVTPVELRKGALSAALKLGNKTKIVQHAEALLAAGDGLSRDELGMIHDVLARHQVSSDPAKAIRHWLAVPAGSPYYHAARLDAGTQLLTLGRTEDALNALLPLTTATPVDAEACQLALAAAEAGQEWRRAIGLCWKLVESAPTGAHAPEYLERIAGYAEHLGDAAERRRALENLVERSSESARRIWALSELQRMSFEQGEWARSLEWYYRLARDAGQPTDPSARYLRAEALVRLGRGDEARAEYRDIGSAGGPLAGQALTRLGALSDQAGEWEDALTAYRQALEHGVPRDVAEWIRQRLAAAPPLAPVEDGSGDETGEKGE